MLAIISGKGQAVMDALVNLQFLVDDAKCFDTVRRLRWPEGVRCTRCGSDKVARDGHDDRQPERQRYRCTACQGRFDDLTKTIFAGHHQPLRMGACQSMGDRGWFVASAADRLTAEQRQLLGRACVSRSSSGSLVTTTA